MMKGALMANEYYPQDSRTQQMPKHSQQYQQQYQQQQYQPAQYQQYAPRQMNIQREGFTSTGQWVLTLFLMCIPILNLILLFVWAFGSNTEPSKQSWARANLIWILIAIIVVIVLSIIAVAVGVDVRGILARYYTVA